MTLHCSVCSADAVIAARPGAEQLVEAGITLDAGEPLCAWCLAHWPNRPLETSEPQAGTLLTPRRPR